MTDQPRYLPQRHMAEEGALDRYLAGQAQPDEAARISGWIDASPDHKEFVELLRAGGESDVPNFDVARAVQRIKIETIGATTHAGLVEHGNGYSRFRWSSLYHLAWVVPIVAIFGIKYIPNNVVSPFQYAVSPKTYSTTPGQRAKLELADGTVVLLAPATIAKVTGRIVELNGQALFTVTHSSGVPFMVQTGKVTTRVLGTSFAIRHYSSDTAVRVVVAQGRVSVGSAVLGTGDIATAINEKKIAISRGNAVTEQLAWAEGRLVFSGVRLRQAIPDLERWYGITINVTDARLLDHLVTTSLDTESAAQAVKVIAVVVEGRGELLGNRAVIHSR